MKYLKINAETLEEDISLHRPMTHNKVTRASVGAERGKNGLTVTVKIWLGLNYQNSEEDQEVATHAIRAFAFQPGIAATSFATAGNPEGAVAFAVAAAAGVVPMSASLGAIGVASGSRARCGTAGCSLHYLHSGLCQIIGNKRKASAWPYAEGDEDEGRRIQRHEGGGGVCSQV